MVFIILFLISVFCIIYYGIVIAYSSLHTSFVWFWPFCAVMTALAAFILQTRFYLSFPSIIHCFIKVFMIIILSFFLILFFKIWNTAHSYKKYMQDADYLIIPGAIVRGSRPSNVLLSRIRTAYDYLESHPKTIAILSGYQNANAKISQGKCMQNELRKMGIPAYRLLVEAYARTTEENLKFSKDYITLQNPVIGIVSNDFHLYRTIKIAKQCGYKHIYGIPAKTPRPILIHCYIRELFAVIKLFLH